MPSLRRSLLLYFLALLIAGLLVGAYLADRAVERAGSDKVEASVQLLQRGETDRIKEANDKFDQALLTSARLVGRTATTDYRNRMDQANKQLGLVYPLLFLGLQSGLSPTSTLGTLSTTLAFHPPLSGSNRRGPPLRGVLLEPLMQSIFAPVQINAFLESQLNEDGHAEEYIQVNTARQTLFRSAKLGMQGLPFHRTEWEADEAWVKYDAVELPGGPGRRIVIKEKPLFLPGWGRVSGSAGGGRTSDGRDQPPPPRPEFGNIVQYFYHVARPTAEHEEQLARIRSDGQQQMDDVRRRNAQEQRGFRLTLAAMGGLMIFGLFVGGWIMTTVGLRPLRQLTEAVSRVSEKDFRLPVNREKLTVELLPIHDRLAQSLAALKHAFEREKEAVADISHELRTPVAGLLTTLEVALRKPRTAEQYRETLVDCRNITKQLSDLVDRVMTLAYLDAGLTQAKPTEVDVSRLAHDCAALIRPLAEANELTLSVEAPEALPQIVDANKLREVLLNLLHNAVEYNSPGGSIHLSVERTGDTAVSLEVRDTGIGMTPEVQAKIFDRFFRADASRTATGVHAGLGLAIVKESVKQLNGTITVESTPDVGSAFCVSIMPAPAPAVGRP